MSPHIRLVIALTIATLAPTGLQAQEAAKEHPLAPAIRLAETSFKTMQGVRDYEALFTKYEVMGRKVVKHSMRVKVRHEPFSVYMGFTQPHEGREVLYVAGQNNGKILAHETGFKSIVGTVALDPLGDRALSESRHPITEFGMKRMVELLIAQWRVESQFGECDVKYYPNAQLGTMTCKVIQVSHPRPRQQFKYHITRLYIDAKSNLPVRVEHYGFPPQPNVQPTLVEQYTYSNVRVNVGLDAVAFSPRNPNYKF